MANSVDPNEMARYGSILFIQILVVVCQDERPEDKKFQYTCPGDKDFTAVAKKSIKIMRYIFFLFLEEKLCCGFSLEEPH